MDTLQNIQLDINKIFLQNIKIKNKLDKHNTIQKEISNLAKKYNLTSELEYRIFYNNRSSKIDIVWHKNNKPFIAIEVDSSLREKSIGKLLLIDCKYKLWLYYGKKKLDFYNFIDNYDSDKKITYITPFVD